MPTFMDPEREDPLSSLLCRKRCVSTGSGASFPPLQRGYWSHPLPLGHNGDGLFQETRLLLAGAQDTIPRPGTHAVAPSGGSCQKPSGPANEKTLPGLLFVERVKSELRFFGPKKINILPPVCMQWNPLPTPLQEKLSQAPVGRLCVFFGEMPIYFFCLFFNGIVCFL